MTKLFEYSESDVNAQLAYDAHRGTSFVPERRRDRAVSDYVQHMQAVDEKFQQWATDDNRDQLHEDLEAYKLGYIKRLEAYWAAHSRIVSTMIVGPSGFPTRTMEKRNETCDKRRDEWLAWKDKRIEKLRRKYDPKLIASAPIQSNDPQAIEKLTAKLEAAQALQDMMKAANRIIRKKSLDDAGKVAALVEMGTDEMTARKLLIPDFAGRIGYASFQLSSNNAKIKRLQRRIADLQAKADAPEPEDRTVGDITIRHNRELDRLQLIFPGKPSAEVRSVLKRNGFRWAPSQMAWQRQDTRNAQWSLERVLEAIG